MSHFFTKLFKWLIFLAICAGLVFLAIRFYQNRRLIFFYVGDQKHFFTEQAEHSGIKIGLSDRAAALSIYAPISLHGSSRDLTLQAVRFAANDDMWAALESGAIDFALVSLDQFAKRAPLSPLCIAFPYALSEGSDGIVCSSAWDKAQSGQTRRIACVTNSTGEYLAQVLADTCMDSSNPLQIVGACSSAEAAELLRSGQVEALAVNQPLLNQLAANGYKHLPNWQNPGIVEVCVLKIPASETRKRLMQKAISQLGVIWFNRLDDLNRSPGPSYSSIAKASGIKRDVVRDTMRTGLHFYSYAEAQEALHSGQLANETLKLSEYWMMSGIYATTAVRSLPDPDSFIFGSAEHTQIHSDRPESYPTRHRSPEALPTRVDDLPINETGLRTINVLPGADSEADAPKDGNRNETAASETSQGESGAQPETAGPAEDSQPNAAPLPEASPGSRATAVPLTEPVRNSENLSPFTVPKDGAESGGEKKPEEQK